MLGLKFRRQHGVGGLILDFYCPSLRLALELDGGVHSESASREYDQARDTLLARFRIVVVRIPNEEATETYLRSILTPLAAGLEEKHRKRNPRRN